MDRSHRAGVQCEGIITLACLIFELLPFVVFHTWILSGEYLQNYTSYGYEISWVDRSHKGEVQCTGIITFACLIFELVPFVVFHTWILFGACPSFTTWGKTGVSCDNLPLLLVFTVQSRLLRTMGNCTFDNFFGKGKNDGNKHFVISHNVFQHFRYKSKHFMHS